MSVYKRGGIYWFKFVWNGERIRRFTKQGNDRIARIIESAYRTKLANSEVGIRERKAVPTLRQFASSKFLPWAEATFAAKPKTWLWSRNGVRRLLEFSEGDRKLNEIAGEQVAAYAAWQADCKTRSLQHQPRATGASSAPHSRRRVGSGRAGGEDPHAPRRTSPRIRYHLGRTIPLSRRSPEPLASVAAVLADTRLRPEECYRLR